MIAAARHIIDEELDAMKELTRPLERGTLVKHEDIEAATGLKRDKAPWGKLIRHWKSWCMDELKVALKSEPGIGYRLCTESEHIEVALRLEKQGIKRVAKAGMIAGVVDPTKLTGAMGQLQQNIVDTAVKVKHEHNVRTAERKSLLSRQESLPRIELSGVR